LIGPVLGLAATWLVLINFTGFVLFAHDKRAAVRDQWRVPERVLLVTAALGASPAMLLATPMLRHKTRKQPFRALLIAIAVVQVIAAIGLLARLAGLL
jgi:uncharacterized membrane protein YsdA (DUF1294 family)